MAKPTLVLDAHLKALRLPTFLREYDKVARHCAQEGLDGSRYLFRLCELEVLDREQRAVERRIKAARFPVVKSLETFEFRAIPSVNKRLVLELARSEYLDRRANVLALGNSGTGKTQLALALGLAACQKGYRVRFTTAAALVNELLEGQLPVHKRRRQVQRHRQVVGQFHIPEMPPAVQDVHAARPPVAAPKVDPRRLASIRDAHPTEIRGRRASLEQHAPSPRAGSEVQIREGQLGLQAPGFDTRATRGPYGFPIRGNGGGSAPGHVAESTHEEHR